jgi:hypothetical protein
MAFADWKKRSKRFCDIVQRALYGRVGAKDLHEVLQAAYKAGERQGRKDAEALAMNAVELRDALRSNAELKGGR